MTGAAKRIVLEVLGWTLLVLGPNPPQATAFEVHAAKMGIDLRAVAHRSQALLDLYEAPLILIRPDQIVAWRGFTAESAPRLLATVTGARD